MGDSGIEQEIFRGDADGENVIISERAVNEEGSYYQLAFERINARDTELTLPELPGDSFGETPPSERECDSWYNSKNSSSLAIGEIIPEAFKRRLSKVLGTLHPTRCIPSSTSSCPQ